MAQSHTTYQSPLEGRYASKEMRELWSPRRRILIWRRLWLALAEAQHEMGLPVSRAQIDELRAQLENIDFDAAAAHESRLRHDVMAHVHAYGDVAPLAKPIIHLGATSQDIVCNADLLLMREGLRLAARKTAWVIDALGRFAAQHRSLPTLGYTHYQPAQPTTVGKRATLWAYDLALALEDLEHRLQRIRFRGFKGATGTQASYLALFNGDAAKVDQLEQLVAAKFGWSDGSDRAPVDVNVVTGQTYPRIIDAHVLSSLACTAAALHKFATDLRLLANRKELEEPFEREQIGSSAMPYKRNPMRCERACALARFVMSLASNGLDTAAVQWLERTLDDSANRRLSLPEAFLALDGTLEVMHEVARGLVIYPRMIAANLGAEMPFMATEEILMAAVKHGADRQVAHEALRVHSQAAAARVKQDGLTNDLLDRLRNDRMFNMLDLDTLIDPARFIGRATEQVDRFIRTIVDPIRARYPAPPSESSRPRV